MLIKSREPRFPRAQCTAEAVCIILFVRKTRRRLFASPLKTQGHGLRDPSSLPSQDNMFVRSCWLLLLSLLSLHVVAKPPTKSAVAKRNNGASMNFVTQQGNKLMVNGR